ncbi:uncharacterized protein LOC143286999 [Babylonia areolata]|uniref:uncharacterized protein LOC143286999 n=1 Tax=Babylonia areolata TaxID=304850 RepID=UPI003FCF91FB
MVNATNNTDTVLSTQFVGGSINSAARAIFSTLGSVMIACGGTGNILLISVIFGRFRQKRHVHDLFIANLTLADTLALGQWMTFLVLDLILGYHPVVNHTHCVVNGVIGYTSSEVSVLSLLAISMNRYLHVCHSHLYSRLFTLPRTVFIIISIWVAAILMALPPALGIDTVTYRYSAHTHICSFDRSSLSYIKILAMFLTTVPMMLIGYCNFAIFRYWKKARVNLNNRKDQRQGRKLFSRWRERGRRSQEEETATDLETETDTNRHQCGKGKGDPVPENEVVPGSFCSSAHKSECRDSHDGNSDCDTGDGNEAVNLSLPTPSSAYKENDDKAQCTGSPVSNPKQIDNEQSLGAEKGDFGHAQKKVTPKRTVVFADAIPSTTTAEEASTITESPAHAMTIPVLSAPDALTSSLGTTRSARSPQKRLLMTAVQNAHHQKKKTSTREVAFVRSLFVVFIITCITFFPYVVILIVSSIVAVPSEVAILGLMLLFSNNSVNWIVYGVMNPSYRKAYRACWNRLLGKCCHQRQEQTDSHPHSSQTNTSTSFSAQRVKAEAERSVELSSSLAQSSQL